MLHHGIDLHKHSIVIGTVDDSGAVIASKRLRTRRADIVRYLNSATGPHSAVVETTTGWYWLADLFHQHDIDLKLAHAFRVKAISAAKVKTDTVDAGTLAQLLWAGLIPEAHMLDPELRPYRDLLRLRQRIVNRRSGEMCAISSILEKYNQPSVDRLPPLPAVEASLHTEQIELLAAQIKEIEKSLNEVMLPRTPVQRLLYIPGFGTTVSFTVFLETGTASRFASDRNYTSYARLVPGAKNSGGKTRNRPSKQGNRYLKNAFLNAAVRAVQVSAAREAVDIYADSARLERAIRRARAATVRASSLATQIEARLDSATAVAFGTSWADDLRVDAACPVEKDTRQRTMATRALWAGRVLHPCCMTCQNQPKQGETREFAMRRKPLQEAAQPT